MPKTATAVRDESGRFKGRNVEQFPTRPDGDDVMQDDAAEMIPERDEAPTANGDGQNDADLVPLDQDSEGNRFLPGTAPVVSKRLYKLASDVKTKRDDMITAKNAYVGVRDTLIREMQDKEVLEFKLDTGEIVQLTDKINVKISKKKNSMSDIDNDELDID